MSVTAPETITWRAIVDIVEAHFPPGPESEKLQFCLDQWREKKHLTFEQASDAFSSLTKAESSDYQIGCFLAYAQAEWLSEDEIAGFASVLRSDSSRVLVQQGETIGDTCGTGGDTFPTFNISTTIMFVLAAGGIKIAKHGNRAFTSKCGSADVLQKLGVAIELGPEQVQECLTTINLGFMFAPRFHPATNRAQHIRKIIAGEMPREIKLKTIFNVLGPLSNPAQAPWQMLGVYDESFVYKLARVMQRLDLKRGIVFHGHSENKQESGEKGLDEVSTIGPTVFAELKSNEISTYMLTPEDMGLRRAKPSDIAGGDIAYNAEILEGILGGTIKGPKRDIVVANAAVGLYLGEGEDRPLQESIGEYVIRAGSLIDDGSAYKKLQELKIETQRLSNLIS